MHAPCDQLKRSAPTLGAKTLYHVLKENTSRGSILPRIERKDLVNIF
jgi:hypothetical protein